MNKNWKKIADAYAGDSGYPGSQYRHLEIRVFYAQADKFEVRVALHWGSNQGYEEEHGRYECKGRGTSVESAIEAVSDDVLGWNGPTSDSVRRAALRECQYEAEDWVDENLSRDEEIAHLRARLEELEAKE